MKVASCLAVSQIEARSIIGMPSQRIRCFSPFHSRRRSPGARKGQFDAAQHRISVAPKLPPNLPSGIDKGLPGDSRTLENTWISRFFGACQTGQEGGIMTRPTAGQEICWKRQKKKGLRQIASTEKAEREGFAPPLGENQQVGSRKRTISQTDFVSKRRASWVYDRLTEKTVQFGNYVQAFLLAVTELSPNHAVPSGHALKEKFYWRPVASTLSTNAT